MNTRTHLIVICSDIAVAKDCGILAVPTNSSATGHKTTYPNKITFSCDDGFNLAGSRVRYCQSTGIWSGNQTSCIGNFFWNFADLVAMIFISVNFLLFFVSFHRHFLYSGCVNRNLQWLISRVVNTIKIWL